MLEQAINATKSIDDRKLADYLRKNEMHTIVGPIRFDADGERANQRLITIQFRDVQDKNLEQFKGTTKQIIVDPSADKTGEFIAPYSVARKAK
jgi:branched-chain amino acid transport system substrate-binding protein